MARLDTIVANGSDINVNTGHAAFFEIVDIRSIPIVLRSILDNNVRVNPQEGGKEHAMSYNMKLHHQTIKSIHRVGAKVSGGLSNLFSSHPTSNNEISYIIMKYMITR